MRIRLHIEPYSPLKPTKVCFIFINRAEDLAAVNHVTHAVVRVGSKKLGLRKYGSSRSF